MGDRDSLMGGRSSSTAGHPSSGVYLGRHALHANHGGRLRNAAHPGAIVVPCVNILRRRRSHPPAIAEWSPSRTGALT